MLLNSQRDSTVLSINTFHIEAAARICDSACDLLESHLFSTTIYDY